MALKLVRLFEECGAVLTESLRVYDGQSLLNSQHNVGHSDTYSGRAGLGEDDALVQTSSAFPLFIRCESPATAKAAFGW